MNRTKMLLSAAALASFALIASPALADTRGGGQSRGGHGGGGGHSSGGGHSGGGGQTHSSSGQIHGGTVARQAGGGRVYSGGRSYVRTGPRVIGSPFIGGSRGFYRPYYTFRPRVSLGFGIWAGYPIGYPYYYGYGYGYPYGYSYPYSSYGYPSYGYPAPAYADPQATYPAQPAQPPTSGSDIEVQPGQTASGGGVSFEITPNTAEVWVDGANVGTVASFGPTSAPLELTTGRHRIQLRAQGYDALAFTVDITQGQVIPYQGTMQSQR